MLGFGSNQQSKHIIPKQMRAECKEGETLNIVLGGLGVIVAIGGGIISFVNGLRLADKVVNEMDKKAKGVK